MNGRGLKIALAASLVGNLFLGGLIAGARLLPDRERERQGPPRHGRFEAVAERLDPADAEALRALLRRTGDQAEPRVAALRVARRDLEAAMGRPDYDPEAVRTALTRARAEEAALRAELDGALIGFAAGLEPDERLAITPLLRKGGRGWRPKEGGERGGERAGRTAEESRPPR